VGEPIYICSAIFGQQIQTRVKKVCQEHLSFLDGF
jgi:hypothetical protein